ncbi:MAG: peptidoglycan DD-metalloendopeptidase family protein [Alphaproteobacteria bacterium]|nr:peptidoglycan DD-metalloendopeptidase family protein [Alphaproteobacteria bacterium]
MRPDLTARLAALAMLASLSACASNPAGYGGPAPISYKHPIGATRQASTERQARASRPAQPLTRTAPVVTDQGAFSTLPAAAEAATLLPETGPRPGGPMLQPEDRPEARRIVIAKGDRLYDISHRYAVSTRALIETNHLSEPYSLKIGQSIYLPPPNIHVVEPGETLYSVGKRFSVDTRSLALLNRMPRPWVVYPGDEILLPPLAKDSTGAPKRTAARAPNAPTRKPSHPASVAVASTPAAAGGAPDFIWPVKGPILRGYGRSDDGLRNDGLNIGADAGVDVRAAASGEVVYAGNELSGFGNLLLVRHADGWVSAYANAQDLLVKEGDQVIQGQVIAHAGSTGSAPSPQVHFELRRGRNPVDPAQYLPSMG